jgi:hypothetical protein
MKKMNKYIQLITGKLTLGNLVGIFISGLVMMLVKMGSHVLLDPSFLGD